MTSVDRSELEKNIQQLFIKLEELRAAIRALQDRSLALSSEIQEIRIAYDTLTNIQQHNQVEVMASLDRQGYVYTRVHLINTDKAIVKIGGDFYALLPIDVAKTVLLGFEREVLDELRKVEAELKQLTDIYTQMQNKLQEYISILVREESRK